MKVVARTFTRIVCGTRTSFAWLPVVALLSVSTAADHQPVAVQHAEGVVHAFLSLSTLDGTRIADGSLTQTPDGDRITARLTFRFRDGSLHDQTTIFTQKTAFHLVSDRVVQKGPSFPRQIDASIEVASGRVRVHYTEDGKSRSDTDERDLPPDVVNGMIPVILKNVARDNLPRTLSYVAFDPHPRLVSLQVSASDTDHFTTGRARHAATDYRLKVDLGGLTGLLAKVAGKQPPDSHVWILQGKPPAFLRSEQPLYAGGPLWRIELTTPDWAGDNMAR